MHVLFVARSHSDFFEMAPFIKAQGESLRKYGIKVSFFLVKGKGLKAYILNIPRLRKYIRQHSPDVIHAHYSLCGWSAVLAQTHLPIVLSFMGSDMLGEYVSVNKISNRSKIVVALSNMIQPFVNSIISKSEAIDQKVIKNQNKYIIPNGVELVSLDDVDVFQIRNELGLHPNKHYILFLNNPADIWKNYQLAKSSVELLNRRDVELIAPFPVAQSEVKKYLLAANVLIMTSFMEGSPNIIKEAMALNRPVVSTNVGDVSLLFGEEEGYYITSFEVNDVVEKLTAALDFSERIQSTNGRKRIVKMNLDAESVSKKLITVYEKILTK